MTSDPGHDKAVNERRAAALVANILNGEIDGVETVIREVGGYNSDLFTLMKEIAYIAASALTEQFDGDRDQAIAYMRVKVLEASLVEVA